MSADFGQQIKQKDLDDNFLTGPGEDLALKTLYQLLKIPNFTKLFGSFSDVVTQQRIADYPRFDWSLRQLPALNLFEAGDEAKDSDNAFLNGTITLQVFWPPNMRRPDFRRVEVAFKGVIENFFASDYVRTMMDELYFIERPEKVYGLNEYGKKMNWSPNTEGIIESEAVPVTNLTISYRIDLRAWYRALEYMNRTKAQPFLATLDDLVGLGNDLDSGYYGVYNNEVEIFIPENIDVTN